MADVAAQSSFPGNVGSVARSDDTRRTNTVVPFVFTAWKDATDTRLVVRPFLITGTPQQALNKALVVRPFLITGTPQQALNKALAMRLDQVLGTLLISKMAVTRGFAHFDIFDQVEKPLTGHLFP